MTKGRAFAVAFVILLLAIGYNTWRGEVNADKARHLIELNCGNISALATIEHTLVKAQAAQSKALLAKGFTFGIPKGELPKLVAQGEALQKRFLDELDELSRTNCRS